MEFSGISSSRKQLLPGILDEITLGHIVPKLPWRAFHVLSSVSRWWRVTIRTRKVFDARVASDSVETLVVFKYTDSEDFDALALYSPTDNVYHRLPPIRDCAHGCPIADCAHGCPVASCARGKVPGDSQLIALDGKLYVLGGRQGPLNSHNDFATAKVYVLDLAGQRQWKLCASMEERREKFGCRVLDGKIYAFGGCAGGDPVTFSEVYDPKVDNWSRIAPMKSYRFNHQVITMGKEFCMHSGSTWTADYFDKQEQRLLNPMTWNRFEADYFSKVDSWEIYHPASDTWRVVDPPLEGLPIKCFGILFVAQGEIYTMSDLGIHFLESDKWTLQGSISCDALGPSDSVCIFPIASLGVGDEILAMMYCCWRDCDKEEFCLLRSRGFGSKDKEIEWQQLLCPLEFADNFSMCPVQL